MFGEWIANKRGLIYHGQLNKHLINTAYLLFKNITVKDLEVGHRGYSYFARKG